MKGQYDANYGRPIDYELRQVFLIAVDDFGVGVFRYPSYKDFSKKFERITLSKGMSKTSISDTTYRHWQKLSDQRILIPNQSEWAFNEFITRVFA